MLLGARAVILPQGWAGGLGGAHLEQARSPSKYISKLKFTICNLFHIYAHLRSCGYLKLIQIFILATTIFIYHVPRLIRSLQTIAKNAIEFSWYIWSQHNPHIKYCILSMKLCNETVHWEWQFHGSFISQKSWRDSLGNSATKQALRLALTY